MRSRRESSVLFRRGQLFELLARQEAEMYSEIEHLDEERLLASPIDALVDYFLQKYKVEMVTLDRPGISIGDHGDILVPQDDFGRSYQASVHAVSFSVPFTGDSQLFHYQGSTLSSMYPRAEVGTGELTIVVMAEQTDTAVLRQKLEQELRLIAAEVGAREAGCARFRIAVAGAAIANLRGAAIQAAEEPGAADAIPVAVPSVRHRVGRRLADELVVADERRVALVVAGEKRTVAEVARLSSSTRDRRLTAEGEKNRDEEWYVELTHGGLPIGVATRRSIVITPVGDCRGADSWGRLRRVLRDESPARNQKNGYRGWYKPGPWYKRLVQGSGRTRAI
jgi:hypothetical protein